MRLSIGLPGRQIRETPLLNINSVSCSFMAGRWSRTWKKAISYLTASADQGNVYAAQLLQSVHSNRNWSVALGSLRLLQHLARIIQNRIEDERKSGKGGIDRKLKRKIDEKKQAHGLKQG